MADTIEWLETIGKSANLRHASAEQLAHALAPTNASGALKEAVISADCSKLFAELGDLPNFWPVDHGSNSVAHEEDLESDHG
jgi:hypothetical protein